jgi:hypothetical protein
LLEAVAGAPKVDKSAKGGFTIKAKTNLKDLEI